ncbi:Uncharacterized protein FWK35_00031688 [Aphis craccivora]|uniref:Uncharacterized protein n=1 Tax=Aphis craccivora TaxID=307492 RepID=A0A6G0YLG7_APHCR|nr:Uncharacterized protein FWK35_00031688 [Aphis craccivora]
MCMYGLSYGGKVVTGNAGSFTRSEPPSCVLHNTHTSSHLYSFFFGPTGYTRYVCVCIRHGRVPYY